MVRKRDVLVVALFFSLVLVLPAQTGDDVAGHLRERGYTVENRRMESGLPTWDVRYETGVPFTLSVRGPLTEERLRALEAFRESVLTLSGLDVRRARAVFEDDRGTLIVSPRSYRIDSRDYAEYMPSGMQFTYEESLAFDFRMLAENLALRINGQFLTEEQFRERIVRAIENPAGYIESSDPQFLARRLEEQQTILDETRSRTLNNVEEILRLDRTDRQLEAARQETERRLDARIEENVQRGESELDRLRREGRAAQNQLERELADLTERHEQLIEQYEALAGFAYDLLAEFESLREGAIALAGRKLFGSLRELDPDAVARVVELRRADPELDPDDARDQVNSELPEEIEPLHARHVQAIYAVFFNDYR